MAAAAAPRSPPARSPCRLDPAQYAGCHGAAELRRWAQWAKTWRSQGRQVYLAFNNDALEPGSPLPSAILDCRTLGDELRRAGVWAA